MRRIPRFACTVVATVMVSLVGSASLAWAAQLRNVPQVLSQPDGTLVECLASGDEYFNFWHDRAGYVIVRDPANGWLTYAALVNGEIRPTAFVVGTVEPAAVKLVAGIRPGREFLRRRGDLFMQPPSVAAAAALPAAAPLLPQINNVVIFIRFSGEGEFTDSATRYGDIFNNTAPGANSLYHYFRENSYGQVAVTGTIVPGAGGAIVSYQDDRSRSYYQPYDATTNPGGYVNDRAQREHSLLRKAVEWAAAHVPASLVIDANGDGLVDNVCFIVRGEATGWQSLLWPHRWSLYTENAYIHGKAVYDYIFLTETRTYTGIFAHELGHSLGAPDLYHGGNCSSAPTLSPVGEWDVMEHELDPPQHSTAYLKSRYFGYLGEIPEITQTGTYTLNPITSATNNAYRIASPGATNEYFVVEYRRRTGTFESSLPASGLLVYRINTATGRNDGNLCGPPDEIYVYRPGGTSTYDGDLDAAPLSADRGRTAMNDGTDPSPWLSDGSPGGLSISDVSSAGETISFKVTMGGGGCGGEAPGAFSLTSPATGTVLGAGTTSATLSWGASAGADAYDVYAGAAADPPLIGSTTATSYSLGVGPGTTYWRVAARNECGATPSPVFGAWSFSVGGATGQVTLLTDDFEGDWPGARDVRGAAVTGWGKSAQRSSGGGASAWCAAGATAPKPAGSQYAPNMNTWIIYGPFSLADATAARLEFDLWVRSESGYDKVGWWASSSRDTGYTGGELSGDSGGWVHKTMDLANAGGANLVGQAQVYVAFTFISDSNTEQEGAYIDNVVISKQSAVQCTAPTITTQPDGLTIASGQTAPLSLTATGTAPLTYQWYRGASGATGDPVAGATSSGFTTPALTATTSYWCRVSNACGSEDSAAATVTVTAPACSASRTLPAGYLAGATLPVSIQVNPPAGSGNHAIEESPPAGWTVGDIDGGGTWDAANQKVKWGPFFDATARTLHYSVTPPAGATGAFTFAGVVSIDGTSQATCGATTIAPSADNQYWLPVISRATGTGGSQWRSDAGLLNRSGASAAVELRMYSSSGVKSKRLTLANGAQEILTDLVAQLAASGSGALEVRSDQPLFVTSRTYNQSEKGTFGQSYDVATVAQGLAAGQSAFIGQLTENASYRTNIALTNTGATSASALVELFNEGGTLLASYTVSLGPGQWKQENRPFATKAGQTSLAKGYARVTASSGSGIIGYASVVDNATSDPTTIPLQR